MTVPDCLALLLKQALPAASHLFLAFDFGAVRHSPGAMIMGLEALGRGTLVRRADVLVRIPTGSRSRRIPSVEGDWDAAAVAFPFGDFVTARHSTGIANIEIHVRTASWHRRLLRALGWLEPALALPWIQRALTWLMTRWPSRTDTTAERAELRTRIYGEVTGGRELRAFEVRTPHSYDVTADTAARIADRLAAGDVAPGFLTPSQLMGAQLLGTLTGVEITSVEGSRARIGA